MLLISYISVSQNSKISKTGGRFAKISHVSVPCFFSKLEAKMFREMAKKRNGETFLKTMKHLATHITG
jgi:hypothetical protein